MIYFFSISSVLSTFAIIYACFILYNKRRYKTEDVKTDSTFKGNRVIYEYIKESGISYDLYFYSSIFFMLLFSILGLIDLVNLRFKESYNHFLMLIIVIGVINLIVLIRKNEYQNKLSIELTKVHKIMYFQSKINTSDEKAITYAALNVTGDLKKKFNELAGCYRLKRDVIKKIEEIRNMSKLEELHVFTHMLEQKFKTGMSEEYHRTSLDMLKRLRLKEHKIKKMRNLVFLTGHIFMLSVLFTIIVAAPFFIKAVGQFQRIFNY